MEKNRHVQKHLQCKVQWQIGSRINNGND